MCPTFALVVPDTRSNIESSLLIGINTLDLLYESLSQTDTNLYSLPYGYRVVLGVLQQTQKQKENSTLGLVKLMDKES